MWCEMVSGVVYIVLYSFFSTDIVTSFINSLYFPAVNISWILLLYVSIAINTLAIPLLAG